LGLATAILSLAGGLLTSLHRRLEVEGRSVTMVKPNRGNADFNDLLAEVVP
jgi:hypothetical protein